MSFLDDAKKFASEHADQTNSMLAKGEELIGDQTNHKFDGQIKQAGTFAEGYLGTDGATAPDANTAATTDAAAPADSATTDATTDAATPAADATTN